ncbi:unnamed protein product [Brachionus calyciflorus]|uniref:Apple domain-containing protein n=1 Tax=Brachionus calyciflorus TaxID=104777 RepID=A0A813YBQ2_9BILA|nr:unnamed protein product [Brachionus calyciflorus]
MQFAKTAILFFIPNVILCLHINYRFVKEPNANSANQTSNLASSSVRNKYECFEMCTYNYQCNFASFENGNCQLFLSLIYENQLNLLENIFKKIFFGRKWVKSGFYPPDSFRELSPYTKWFEFKGETMSNPFDQINIQINEKDVNLLKQDGSIIKLTDNGMFIDNVYFADGYWEQ